MHSLLEWIHQLQILQLTWTSLQCILMSFSFTFWTKCRHVVYREYPNVLRFNFVISHSVQNRVFSIFLVILSNFIDFCTFNSKLGTIICRAHLEVCSLNRKGPIRSLIKNKRSSQFRSPIG